MLGATIKGLTSEVIHRRDPSNWFFWQTRPMDDLLRAGINFFNDGLYYEAHESWEDMWRVAGKDERLFCQGLVQIAVGLHHRTNGNVLGGNRVLGRGLGHLENFPDQYMGVDNSSLVGDIHAVLENRCGSRIRIHCL